ncbi:MFS transporter [Streptomyces laurentii]|uniref:MFS transporter n=1 Tax=Streptomyces laurentii TaxID=39478 RepID=UPI003679CC36
MASLLSRLKRWPFTPGQAKFRKLWAAESVSQMGAQVSMVAFPLVAILILDVGTVGIGLIAAAERAPYLLLGLPAGVFVERWNHRVVMITADWVRAAAILSIPLLAWSDHLSIALMCAVVFVVGMATVFFDIAYQSILTSVVDQPDLIDANRLLESSAVVSQTAGPGIAALLLRVLPAPYAVAVNAATFAFSALFLHSIGKVRAVAEESPEPASVRQELLGGLVFIRKNPLLRWIALIAGTWNLLLQALMAVFFVFLSHELHLSASAIATVVFVGAVGGVFGIAVMGRVNAWCGVGLTVCVATGASAVGGLVLAFAGGAPMLAAVVVGAAFFLQNASNPLFDVNVITIRQTITPQHLMSRTTAAIRTIIWGALPLGALVGGFLGEAIGTRASIAVLGVALLLPAGLTFVSPIRGIRSISDVAPEPASEDSSSHPHTAPAPEAAEHPLNTV